MSDAGTLARARGALLGAAVAVALGGCSSEPRREITAPEPTPFTPTVTVRTGEVGTIRNAAGVQLTIFPRSVPLDASGEPGAILFRVDPATIPAMPPEGFELSGEPWRFSPGDLALADRCRIAMTPADSSRLFVLARFDASSDAWKLAPTVVDPARGGRLTVDVLRLGDWTMLGFAGGTPDSAPMGRVRFRNADSTRAVTLSILEYGPPSPAMFRDFDPGAAGAIVAEAGHSGGAGDLRSDLEILLPPGVYLFQATRSSRLPSIGGSSPDGWTVLTPVTVEGAQDAAVPIVTLHPSEWTYVNPSTQSTARQ